MGDVVNDEGRLLSFPQASFAYALGMHHRFIWRKIGNLMLPFLPIPRLGDKDMLQE